MIFTNNELMLSPFTWSSVNKSKVGFIRSNTRFLYVDNYDDQIRASIGVISTKIIESYPKDLISEIMDFYNTRLKNNISDISYHDKSILNCSRELYEGYYKSFKWYYDIEEDIALYWRFKLEGIGAILS